MEYGSFQCVMAETMASFNSTTDVTVYRSASSPFLFWLASSKSVSRKRKESQRGEKDEIKVTRVCCFLSIVALALLTFFSLSLSENGQKPTRLLFFLWFFIISSLFCCRETPPIHSLKEEASGRDIVLARSFGLGKRTRPWFFSVSVVGCGWCESRTLQETTALFLIFWAIDPVFDHPEIFPGVKRGRRSRPLWLKIQFFFTFNLIFHFRNSTVAK